MVVILLIVETILNLKYLTPNVIIIVIIIIKRTITNSNNNNNYYYYYKPQINEDFDILLY